MAVDRNENLLTSLGSRFTKELELVVQQVLADRGVKQNSDLSSSVEFVYTRDSIQMVVNDYYSQVSAGRKPSAKKIPIYALINWIKKNNITSTKYSTNQLASVIQRSIYKQGIKGKNFIQLVEDSVADLVEERFSDSLEEIIADSLYTSFQVGKV
jgi:hypothetical protein